MQLSRPLSLTGEEGARGRERERERGREREREVEREKEREIIIFIFKRNDGWVPWHLLVF
jgi:hypothetical protein